MSNFILGNIVAAGLYDATTDALVAPFEADEISFDIDSAMNLVYAGTSMYPVTTIKKDRAPKSNITAVKMNLSAYYRILGATNTAAAAGTPQQLPVQEPYVIKNETVTLDNTPSTVKTTLTVIGIDDTVYTKVASAPTQGEYSITGGTLTFNTADEGKAVIIAYYIDITSGGKMSVGAAAVPGIWTLKATGKELQAIDDPAKPMNHIAVVAKSVQLISTLNIDFKRQTASQSKMDFTIMDPGPSFDPIDIITDAAYK